MSDDTDERMERAHRIRQMREGQRENVTVDTDDGSRDSGAPSTVDDSPPSGDTGTDDSSDVFDSGESTHPDVDGDSREESGERDDGNAPAEDPDGTAARDPSTDPTGDAQSSSGESPDTHPSPDGVSDDLDDEATAAAERAAQAATAVTGDVASGATSGDSAIGQAAAGATSTAGPDDSSGGTATAAPMQGPTGVELPDEESAQAAIAGGVVGSGADETTGSATGRRVAAQDAVTDEETVRVLEFTLGDEHYCLDIAHVEEIVKREAITRVPNTPEYVEGVVDLRGQITTVLDPKLLLDIDQEGSESLLVVFAPEEFEDQGAIGWVVDDVRQVAPIARSDVSSAPVDADYIEGVIDRDDEAEFVIWTDPEAAIRLATGEHESAD